MGITLTTNVTSGWLCIRVWTIMNDWTLQQHCYLHSIILRQSHEYIVDWHHLEGLISVSEVYVPRHSPSEVVSRDRLLIQDLP